MDHASRVSEIDRAARVDERAQQLLARHVARDLFGQRRAGDAFHREVRLAVGIATDRVHGHDRRMLEPRLDLCFAQKPRDGIGRHSAT
jgi:hypothetical protein